MSLQSDRDSTPELISFIREVANNIKYRSRILKVLASETSYRGKLPIRSLAGAISYILEKEENQRETLESDQY